MRMMRSVKAKVAATKRTKTKSDIVPGFSKASICDAPIVFCHPDLGNDVDFDFKTKTASMWIANVVVLTRFDLHKGGPEKIEEFN